MLEGVQEGAECIVDGLVKEVMRFEVGRRSHRGDGDGNRVAESTPPHAATASRAMLGYLSNKSWGIINIATITITYINHSQLNVNPIPK